MVGRFALDIYAIFLSDLGPWQDAIIRFDGVFCKIKIRESPPLPVEKDNVPILDIVADVILLPKIQDGINIVEGRSEISIFLKVLFNLCFCGAYCPWVEGVVLSAFANSDLRKSEQIRGPSAFKFKLRPLRNTEKLFEPEIIKFLLNLMCDPSPIGLLTGRQGECFSIYAWAIDSCWILISILLVNDIKESSSASHIGVQEAKGEDELISRTNSNFHGSGVDFIGPGDIAIYNRVIESRYEQGHEEAYKKGDYKDGD